MRALPKAKHRIGDILALEMLQVAHSMKLVVIGLCIGILYLVIHFILRMQIIFGG